MIQKYGHHFYTQPVNTTTTLGSPPQGTSLFIQLSLLLVQTALLCDVSDHNNRLSILRSSLSVQLFMQNLIWE